MGINVGLEELGPVVAFDFLERGNGTPGGRSTVRG